MNPNSKFKIGQTVRLLVQNKQFDTTHKIKQICRIVQKFC